MTPDEYMEAKTAAVAAAALAAQRAALLAARAALSPIEWLRLLQLVFPEVERRRTEVASLARTFYDTERRLHVPVATPRNDRPLMGSNFEVFVKEMQPVRKLMLQESAPRKAVPHFTMRVAREVEMAGRRQIVNAVEVDPYVEELIKAEPTPDFAEMVQQAQTRSESRTQSRAPVFNLAERREQRPAERQPTPAAPDEPRLVKGWARVATGRETCAWCLMLISRGPVYSSSETGGLNVDETTTIDLWNEAGQDLQAFRASLEGQMSEWHAGCDCVTVPVFDRANWVGRDAHKEAEQLWITSGKAASALIKAGESRTDDIYKETLNHLRRRLYAGEISVPSYAQAA